MGKPIPSMKLYKSGSQLGAGSFLAGNRRTALPAAVFSGVMFLIFLGLYVFVERVDSEVGGSGNGC